MEYSLGPVPWSLATADGMPIKSKAPDKDRQHTQIIDGNALFHSLSQIPEAFGEIAKKYSILYLK